MLDEAPIQIARTGVRCGVASNGKDYLVVWGWDQTYAARFNGLGQIQDSPPLTVCRAPSRQINLKAVSNGEGYLVVWQDNRKGNEDIYGARVSREGMVLDPDGFVICDEPTEQSAPAVASNGRDYLVAWKDMRSSPFSWMVASRVTADAAVLDSNGISVNFVGRAVGFPLLEGAGAGYLAVYREGLTFMRSTISASGVVTERKALPVAPVLDAALVGNGEGFLLVGNPNTDVYGARLTSAGDAVDTNAFIVSYSGNLQIEPSAASDRTNYLAVWHDWRSGHGGIFGARLTPGGRSLDPGGLEICQLSSYRTRPVAAASRGNYLAAWEDSRNGSVSIYGTLISSSGQIRNPNGFALASAGSHCRIAGNEDGFLLIWTDYGVRAKALTPQGIPLTAQILSTNRSFGSVAANETNFLVMTEEVETGRLFGALLDSNGRITKANISFPWSRAVSTIASDGKGFLAVWPGTWPENAIYAMPLTADGVAALPEPVKVYQPPSGFVPFSIMANSTGREYFVAWQKHPAPPGDDIFGARVLADGTVVDAVPIPIGRAYSSKVRIQIASNGTNYLAAYQAWETGVARIRGNLIRVTGPLALDAPAGFLNSQFSVLISGAPGTAFDLETSTNLLDWSVISRTTNFTGQRVFTDPAPVTDLPRFYRARKVPNQ